MSRAPATAPVITFLSDYGLQDEFVGVCHGVIARRCPHARVIDLTHAIPPHDVRTGALVLAGALPFMPAGIHLAVVDPGVGETGDAARRAIALRTAAEDRMLVGPDNGLLMLAAERFGGALEGVDISDSPERAAALSRTFHGRDLFAPVAAALAAGEPLSGVGGELDVAQLRRLQLPVASIGDGGLRAHVLHADRFGNLILDATPKQLSEVGVREGSSVALQHADHVHAARRAGTFAEVPVGELLIYEDAQRMVALAVNQGSAAELLGAALDDELLVRPA
jgi:S-adenosyl-L-methionine hydrolase (adenosine-forming)